MTASGFLRHRMALAIAAAALALSGCASSSSPQGVLPPETGEHRATPEQDVIAHRTTLDSDALSSSAMRLSGSFTTPDFRQRVTVTGSYLIGTNETPALARQRLLAQLQDEAILQSGVYEAYEEHLQDSETLSAKKIHLSGALATLDVVDERMESQGDRAKLVITAHATVDGNGLREQIEAMYGNHSLRSAVQRLQSENHQLRRGEARRLTERNFAQRTNERIDSAYPAANRIAIALDNEPGRVINANELAPWMDNGDLLQLNDFSWARGFTEKQSSGWFGNEGRLYAPQGAEAVAQDRDSLAKMRIELRETLWAVIEPILGNTRATVLSQTPRDGAIDYTIEVSGFDGMAQAIGAATGLPLEDGFLTPDELQSLDPWSRLRYWLVADLFAEYPVMVFFTAESPLRTPNEEIILAAYGQPLFTNGVVSTLGQHMAPIMFTSWERTLWYLNGQLLPNTGMGMATTPILKKGRGNLAQPEWASVDEKITEFDPANGRIVFSFTYQGTVPITNFTGFATARPEQEFFPIERSPDKPTLFVHHEDFLRKDGFF